MTEEKHSFSVEIERIDVGELKGIAIKNIKIENLSIPELTLISALLIDKALKYNEEEKDTFEQMITDMFIKMTMELAVNGKFDFNKISDLSQKEFLEHCFNMEHKGE